MKHTQIKKHEGSNNLKHKRSGSRGTINVMQDIVGQKTQYRKTFIAHKYTIIAYYYACYFKDQYLHKL